MLAAGSCASLVGIGLARFAYTPLLPVIINAQWFSASSAAYLGAANLAGYLAGALLGAGIARRTGTTPALRLMMVLATAAFFACSVPLSFIWFFVWRFVSGVSGGTLMVLAATAILPYIRPSRRGLASGIIFMGVGIGVVASGTLVPMLLHFGLSQTWAGLGLLSLLLTLLVWSSWPDSGVTPYDRGGPAGAVNAKSDSSRWQRRNAQSRDLGLQARSSVIADSTTSEAIGNNTADAGSSTGTSGVTTASRSLARRLSMLYLVYGLNAVGLVAHMVFLVDYVARGLGWGVNSGSVFWIIYGLGAVAGPMCCGVVADRIGYAPTLRGALLIQLVMVIIPVFTASPILLGLSCFVVGAFTPGIVPLVLGRLREMLPHSATDQRTAWSRATTAFALMQAAAAYTMSFVFARSGGQYVLLFMLAAVALAIAFVIFWLLCAPPRNTDLSNVSRS